jgi:hypothetical protein
MFYRSLCKRAVSHKEDTGTRSRVSEAGRYHSNSGRRNYTIKAKEKLSGNRVEIISERTGSESGSKRIRKENEYSGRNRV